LKNKKASLSAFTQKRLCLYELHYTPEKNICQSFFEKNQLDKQVEKSIFILSDMISKQFWGRRLRS